MDKKQRHRRKSIRLKEFNYSTPGYYFVTICTKGRKCLFGDINEQGMRLNNAGHMVKKVWGELPVFYNNVSIDEFVIMPKHVHGIIIIDLSKKVGGGAPVPPRKISAQSTGNHRGLPLRIIN